MAVERRFLRAPQRYELRIHDISPEDIEPNGDRYVVEVIDFDETILMGQMLVVTQDPKINPTDPTADPRLERRGVIGAVILRAGNGHLLGYSDPRIYVGHDRGRNYNPSNDIVRVPADVPMFFQPGDVVFVDHNMRGRDLKILGREVRIVSQIDILGRLEGISLMRVDGEWQEVKR